MRLIKHPQQTAHNRTHTQTHTHTHVRNISNIQLATHYSTPFTQLTLSPVIVGFTIHSAPKHQHIDLFSLSLTHIHTQRPLASSHHTDTHCCKNQHHFDHDGVRKRKCRARQRSKIWFPFLSGSSSIPVLAYVCRSPNGSRPYTHACLGIPLPVPLFVSIIVARYIFVGGKMVFRRPSDMGLPCSVNNTK